MAPVSAKADLGSGLSLHLVPDRVRDLGAARLVSTPSRTIVFPPGLARDCHLKGSPEFEQFYIAGFPAGTQVAVKSGASAISATPAWQAICSYVS
jgi:hypothetical protein